MKVLEAPAAMAMGGFSDDTARAVAWATSLIAVCYSDRVNISVAIVHMSGDLGARCPRDCPRAPCGL